MSDDHVVQTAAGGTLSVRLSPDAPAATVKAVTQMLRRARAGKPEPPPRPRPLWVPLQKIDYGAVVLRDPGFGLEIEEKRKRFEKQAAARRRERERAWLLTRLTT